MSASASATGEAGALVDRPELWEGVVGQPAAVAQLRAALRSPVHAYLLVGPPGAGSRAAATGFAAAVLGADAARRGDDVERAIALGMAETHPDLHVFEPGGARLSADEAREIVRLAARTPVEGDVKVVVLTELHRVEIYGAILLKTVEEPPPSTVFVILADEVVPDLVTIASRSVRIDFGPVPTDVLVGQLVAEGAARDIAEAAAEAASGDVTRARLLVTDPALSQRRETWASVARRLDGTGHTAAMLVDEVLAAIDDAQAPLDERLAEERARLQERIEAYGQRGSGAAALESRHRRAVRRHRADELRFGLAVLAAQYRDRLGGAAADRALDALGRIQRTAEALDRNPVESLLLQALFVSLPAA